MEQLSRCILCNSNNLFIACEINNFSRCHQCGLIFDNPRPDSQEVSKYYSKEEQYDHWLVNLEERENLWKKRVSIIEKYIQSGRMLDIGAGIGQFLSKMKYRFSIQGTEISTSAIKIAKHKFNIDLIKGDFDILDFPEKFDLITMIHVLEHVPYPGVTLKKCYDILNEGGILVVAVPNDIAGIKTWIKKVAGKLVPRFKAYGNLGIKKINLAQSNNELHLSHFQANTLKNQFKQNGFEILTTDLDPYAIKYGFNRLVHRCYYFSTRWIFKLIGVNLYDTLLVIGKKVKDKSQGNNEQEFDG